jgi:predicted dithiol-disulfide oxidoreductase (DUF899 family)
MPWVAVDKPYVFEGPDGTMSLLDLFDGRRQLIIYRAYFDAGVHGHPDGTAGVEHGRACVGALCSPTMSAISRTSMPAPPRWYSPRARPNPTSSG